MSYFCNFFGHGCGNVDIPVHFDLSNTSMQHIITVCSLLAMTWIRFLILCFPLWVLLTSKVNRKQAIRWNGKMLNSFEKTKRKKKNICFKGFQRPQENQQIEFQGNHNTPLQTRCISFIDSYHQRYHLKGSC